MRILFNFRNVDSSEAIKLHARDKLAKLEKYLPRSAEIEVTVITERHIHRADMCIHARGARYQSCEESEDMYASINLAVDKLDRQLRDHSATRTTRRRQGQALDDLDYVENAVS